MLLVYSLSKLTSVDQRSCAFKFVYTRACLFAHNILIYTIVHPQWTSYLMVIPHDCNGAKKFLSPSDILATVMS